MSTFLMAMINTERGKSVLKKMLSSEDNVFQKPGNISGSISYSPATLLEDGDWYSLAGFSKKPYCFEFLTPGFSSVDYDEITSSDFGKIVFLCGFQDNEYYFQRVTLARQVNQRRVFFFGEQCKYEKNSTSISLNDFPDAIYDPSKDILYFRKLRDISAVFDGIDELYREATDEEVRNFLGYSFIELADGFIADNVKTNNRKRITMALETLKHFSDDEREKIFDYIKEYCPELICEDKKFRINNEESLKKLLYGIEQRYYTTRVGDERRLANSISVVQNNTGA
jgi:hypothetical protein